MRVRLPVSLAVAALASAALAAPAAAQSFTFQNVPVGTPTPLAITALGLTATFGSPSDPGAFVVDRDDEFRSSAFTENFLAPRGGTADLRVDFSRTVDFVGLAFASAGPAAFTLDAYLGATLVGSVRGDGAMLPGFTTYEALIQFVGPAFDNLRLSATRDFAVDNVAVRPTAVVPEPATFVLVGSGVLGLGAAGRRRAAV